MSTVEANNLRAHKNGLIVVDGFINHSKAIVQTKHAVSIARNTTSMPASGFSAISDLNLVITPKFSTSTLFMQWVVNCESNYNMTFVVARNGTLIADSGYEGYNSLTTATYSGIASGQYDNNNQDSTPSNITIQYFVPAVNTSERTYSLGVRSSDGAASTFYLNRTVGSAGAENYEQMASTAMIMEIAA